MNVTLKQIAARVGVSQPLVSYALNGNPRVSEETRQRVIDAAREMGYDPNSNRGARALAARRHGTAPRTGVLALLLPLAGKPESRVQDNPFFLPYLSGVELEASLRGYDLFVCSMRDGTMPRLIQSGGVDGIVGIHVALDSPQLRTLHLPMLSLGAEGGRGALVPDDASGISQAVSHLVELGHTRIGYVGFRPSFSTPRNRLKAYKKALISHSLSVDESIIEATTNRMQRTMGSAGVDNLLARGGKFTALVCYNDLLAMGAIERLHELGFKVPRDIAVTGFDDYAFEVGFQPSLTSAAFDRHVMARRVVEMLCASLDGKGNRDMPDKIERFPVNLVRRDTT